MRSSRRALFVGMSLLCGGACGGKLDTSRADPAPPPATFVSKITGAAGPDGRCPPTMDIGSLNATSEKWQVAGTDLGITWEADDKTLLVAFGDSFRDPLSNDPVAKDWRSNALALSTDKNLDDGMSVDLMVEDRPGHARQFVARTPGFSPDREATVIPTAAIAIGARSYVHFMSVAKWGARGVWSTNYSALVYSDDRGESWTRADGVRWSGDSNFAMAALAKMDGYVYVFGTPSGRFGGVRLARVPEASVLDPAAYEYFAGDGFRGEAEAVSIVAPSVGELSVQRHKRTGAWLMTYLNQPRQAIVFRTAERPEGPWGEERVLIDTSDPAHPNLYGGYMHPWGLDGDALYLTVSKSRCYNVFLARVPMTR